MDKLVCAIRGYHHYRHSWQPFIGEGLTTEHDQKNPYDKNAILVLAASFQSPTKVGYLPREISEDCCKFITEGGLITGMVTDNVRASNVKGKGLEVPCEFTFKHSDKQLIETVIRNALDKYEFVSFAQSSTVISDRDFVLSTTGTVYETFGSRAAAILALSNKNTINESVIHDVVVPKQRVRRKRERSPDDKKLTSKKKNNFTPK